MLIAMGCDADLGTTKTLYHNLKGIETSENLSLTLPEYARLVNMFVDEQCDPVDGLIETIKERYDPEQTGCCQYQQILEFLEEHDYLGSEAVAVRQAIEEYR